MPLAWQDVKPGLVPQAFTVRTVARLLARPGVWTDYAGGARSLADAIVKITRVAAGPAGTRASRTKR
jgi:DNA primase